MPTLILAALLCTLSPPKTPAIPPEPPPAVQPHTEQFILTPDSDVRLDGKPILFADVPVNATVTQLDVAGDHKTILKLYFKSRGKP